MSSVTQLANANTVVTTGWTNPTNAYAGPDSTFATAAPGKSTSITTDYGFPALGIPPLSTISNVTFTIDYLSSTTGSTGALIGLQGNDNGTLMGTESTFSMTTTETTQTKAYTTGLPPVSDLNSANVVKARVRGFRSSSNTAITWSLDDVKITVTYTAGYQLSTTSASFTETGNSITPGVTLPVSSASLVETGNATTLSVGFLLSTTSSSFTLTRNSANLYKNSSLPASVGTVNDTSNAITFSIGFPVSSASYSEIGNNLGITKQSLLSASTGSIVETGNSATIGVSLPINFGSFIFTGNAVTLSAQVNTLNAAVGSFTLTGENTNFVTGISLIVGTFVETNSSTKLTTQRLLSSSVGSFTNTGENLLFSIIVNISPVSFTISGNDTVLSAGRDFAVSSGIFIESTFSSSLLSNRVINGVVGSFSFITNTSQILLEESISTGNFSLTGNSVNLIIPGRLQCDTAYIIFNANSTDLLKSSILPLSCGTLSETDTNTDLLVSRDLICDTSNITILEQNIIINLVISLISSFYNLSGFDTIISSGNNHILICDSYRCCAWGCTTSQPIKLKSGSNITVSSSSSSVKTVR